MRDQTRRRILRTHGTLMIAIGLLNAGAATFGWETGVGPMGFLRDQPLGHVGLIQAYLLITVIGAALWMGAAAAAPRKWHAMGLLAHAAVLPAYALHWNRFATYSPGGGQTRAVILLHLVLITIEGYSLSRPSEEGA